MYDRILDQTGPLGLNDDQVRQVLGTTVALIFSPEHGGPRAFLQTVRQHGLEGELESWLGPGPNRPITSAQALDILGPDAVAAMARRTGLSGAGVADAVAAILPQVVHELSEHGDLPASTADIPRHVHGGVGNLQHYLDEVAHWGRAAVNAGAATLGASVGVVPDAPLGTTDQDEDSDALPDRAARPADNRSHLLPWLAIAVAAALVFLVLRECGHEAPVEGVPSPERAAPPAPPG